MPWLHFANSDIDWATTEENHLQWKEYDTKIALKTTCCVEMTDAKTFAEKAINIANKIYVMHVKYISNLDRFTREAIMAVVIDLKQQDFDDSKVLLPQTYQDFAKLFSNVEANKLPERTLYNYAINLINERQPLYRLVYNLSEIELTALKQYIDKHLANRFI